MKLTSAASGTFTSAPTPFHEDGRIDAGANPNGAARNIAGICNAGKNVFGMMPHPERATSTALGNTDGRLILAGLVEAGALVV